MRLVDEVELVVVPLGALGALVRAVPDLARRLRQRRGGSGRVEEELDHLPVALVRVVEVVEGVEEPVLQREFAGVCRLGHDVRVDRRLAAGLEPARPLLVAAARVERVAGKVEVVFEAVHEVCGLGSDLDEVGAVPRPAQRDGGLVDEQEIDVDRVIRLAPARALLLLLDEPDDGREALRQCLLVSQVGRTPPASRRARSGRSPGLRGSSAHSRGARGRPHARRGGEPSASGAATYDEAL